MHSSGILIERFRNPVTTSSSKGHIYLLMYLKIKGLCSFEAQLDSRSQQCHLDFDYLLSFFTSTFLCSDLLSLADDFLTTENMAAGLQGHSSVMVLGRDSIYLSSLDESPRISLVWVMCPHGKSRTLDSG